MAKEKDELIPAEQPAPPEEMLSDKLAEQADAVTVQLRDLLTEMPGTAAAVETAADAAAPAGAGGQPETPVRSAAPAVEATGAAVPPLEPPGAAAAPAAPTEEPVEAPQPAESLPLATVPVDSSAQPSPSEPQTQSSSDDRLMAALAWLTMVLLQLPIVSVIQLLSAGTKDRLFQRHHAVTSLLFYVAAIVYEVVAGIVYTILGALTLGCGYACLWVIFFLPHALGLYYALQAYNGKLVELPVLSNFGRRQGWL